MGKGFIIFILLLVVFGYWYYQQPEEKQDELLNNTQSLINDAKDKWEDRESNINDEDTSNDEESTVVERLYECVTDEDCNTHIEDCVNCYCELGKCYEVI